MERTTLLVFAASVLAATSCLAAGQSSSVPPPKPAEADMLVGAFYFPGWCKEHRWYCIKASETAQHPLLGYYREGDPEAADWHIKWALEHGVSFFAFDFYSGNGSQMLETALDEGFLKSKYIDRFKFCLNWCNHVPADTMTAAELERFGDLIVDKYLSHPSYLKIDGKPVVMILVGAGFVRNLGVQGAKEAFAKLDSRCREAGLKGVHLIFCEGGVEGPQDVARALAAGAQGFCLYNYPYHGTDCTGPGKHVEASYQDLTVQGKMLWEHWSALTGGNFWPTVMPGWDRRPWTKDLDLVRTGSTPELFGKSLAKAREFVSKDRIVMIEAWNEWGEGSVLEPSVEHRFAYLDEVRKVFCATAGDHTDSDPKTLGLTAPVFDVELPSQTSWSFDYDTEGWSPKNLAEVHTYWGAFVCTSVTDDPQLVSPITYLKCDDYPKARVRMRAVPLNTAAQHANGQFFWSTVDREMCEDLSVHFTIPLDGKWHDLVLGLSNKPNWRGVADKFRLDPVDTKGVRVEVDEVCFDSK